MRVMNLEPGVMVQLGETTSTYIGRIDPHPLYPHLWMVIWWLPKEGRYSFDALSPLQDVGTVLPYDIFSRQAALQSALFGGPK